MSSQHTVLTISEGHTFLEGPRWHRGDLYVSDFFTNSVLRFRGGSAPAEVVTIVPGRPSGLGFAGDLLLVVSMLDQRIMAWDGGELALFADLKGLVRGPLNDMAVDTAGRCYVGGFGHSADSERDFGPTGLIAVEPDGGARTVASGLNFPNGIALASGGTELLVAETYAGRVRAYGVQPDGDLSDPSDWCTFDAVTYFDVERAHREVAVEPDGLAVNAAGQLWVADAKGSGIGLYERGGELVDFVEVPGGLSVYAAALGGPEGDVLFMCCAPRNRTADLSVLRSGVLMAARVGS